MRDAPLDVTTREWSRVVTETGARTEFGAIAMRLGDRQPETEFQAGLRCTRPFLVPVTAVMAVGIFVVNIALGRDALESLMFALAIAAAACTPARAASSTRTATCGSSIASRT
jgi:Mg2+-importing ATPase